LAIGKLLPLIAQQCRNPDSHPRSCRRTLRARSTIGVLVNEEDPVKMEKSSNRSVTEMHYGKIEPASYSKAIMLGENLPSRKKLLMGSTFL